MLRAGLIIYFIFIGGFTLLPAQDKCGTVILYEEHLEENPDFPKLQTFEWWMQKKRAQRQQTLGYRSNGDARYILPVVVHVIHNGEPEGEGTNIPDEQIYSQIEVLNEDFRRLNADTISTPTEFLPVAADAEIEFQLARRDPEGLPTSGILRTEGTKNSYSLSDNDIISGLSYWPAEDYLNIWVFPASGNTLGWAEYPVANLPGLEEASNNRLIDGVFVGHRYFGSRLKGDFPALDDRFDQGRTATHEMGHFLGLRHIWGDGGCEADDFCEDTPAAAAGNTGCPESRFSCESNDMFQNYMDYTRDRCMNLFTGDQVGRMQVVLENSPRRASLLNSDALDEPIPFFRDMGIVRSVVPDNGVCSPSVTPKVLLRNYGTDPIFSTRIALVVNGMVVQEKQITGVFAALDTVSVSFDPVVLATSGEQSIGFEVLESNNLDDQNPENNRLLTSFFIAPSVTLPIREGFEGSLGLWQIRDPQSDYTWQTASIPYQGQPNTVLTIDHRNSNARLAAEDQFISPAFDLSNYYRATLSFDVAYQSVAGVLGDGLSVALVRNCGFEVASEDVIYAAYGESLATVPDDLEDFVPTERLHWRRVEISLRDYVGLDNLQLAFISVNGSQAPIYLDNIELTGETRAATDLTILAVHDPPLTSCDGLIIPVTTFYNTGYAEVNQFSVDVRLNDEFQYIYTYDGASIQPLFTKRLTLPQIPAQQKGSYRLDFTINEVNGVPVDPENHSTRHYFAIYTDTDRIPLREDFENFDQSTWTFLNRDGSTGWEIGPAAGNSRGKMAAVVPAFTYQETGEEDAIVSPVLDFSEAEFASMRFKLSYGYNLAREDNLKIFVSRDCGITFPEVVYDFSGEDIGVEYTTAPWAPRAAEDWREEFVALNKYAGLNNLRFAFVFRNAHGNNIYLDDIEFFTSQFGVRSEVPDGFSLYPNPLAAAQFKVTLNLNKRQPILIRLVDVSGKEHARYFFEDMINQTVQLDLPPGLTKGVYVVQVVGTSSLYAEKLIVTQ